MVKRRKKKKQDLEKQDLKKEDLVTKQDIMNLINQIQIPAQIPGSVTPQDPTVAPPQTNIQQPPPGPGPGSYPQPITQSHNYTEPPPDPRVIIAGPPIQPPPGPGPGSYPPQQYPQQPQLTREQEKRIIADQMMKLQKNIMILSLMFFIIPSVTLCIALFDLTIAMIVIIVSIIYPALCFVKAAKTQEYLSNKYRLRPFLLIKRPPQNRNNRGIDFF